MKARTSSMAIFGALFGLSVVVGVDLARGSPDRSEAGRSRRSFSPFFFSCVFAGRAVVLRESSSLEIRPASLARFEFVRKPYIRRSIQHEHSWIGLRIHPETCGEWSEVSRACPNLDEGSWGCGWR